MNSDRQSSTDSSLCENHRNSIVSISNGNDRWNQSKSSACPSDDQFQVLPKTFLQKLWCFTFQKPLKLSDDFSFAHAGRSSTNRQRRRGVIFAVATAILINLFVSQNFLVISKLTVTDLHLNRILSSLLIYFNMHLRRPIPRNQLDIIVQSWGQPGSSTYDESTYPTEFSQGVVPIPCHSHNDYWRRVPLYDALEAGCTGVEADVWLTDSGLLVGHSQSSLTPVRSLETLYIQPLVSILTHQNPSTNYTVNMTSANGVFDMSPETTLILLIDIKSDGAATFPEVLKSLEPIRSRGWLTYFDGSVIVPGPVTVVGSGNTPFDLILSNNAPREIFFDVPLDQLWGQNAHPNNSMYTSENSLYASVSMQRAIGKLWLGMLSPSQVITLLEIARLPHNISALLTRAILIPWLLRRSLGCLSKRGGRCNFLRASYA